MATWERKRAPDEVPTPVAVALSDFCRRAKASASAAEVREALSLLAEAEDFRVRELAEQEPKAQPLGPFAVVDVLSGTEPAVAATRQQSGYYALARELVEERERKAPPPLPAPEPAPAPRAEPAPAVWSEPHALEKPRKRAEKEKPLTVAEKIAPKKRLEPAPKRELPAPRGRFTRVEGARRPAGELFNAESKELLEGMLEQHPHRFALTRALAAAYSGRAGSALGMPDVLDALREHGLLEGLERKEKELVVASFAEHRGASGRVAWALSLNPSEVHKLVEALGIGRQVEDQRERFRREALDARNFAGRLDLLGRSKYLADLGIEKRFTESLRGELRGKLAACVEDASSITELFELAGKRNAVSPELLSRAADRLKLTEELRRKLHPGSSPHASS